MNRDGHVGVAALVFAPIGLALSTAGLDVTALLAGGAAALLSGTPDCDQRIPGLTHRGLTHTPPFALLVGASLALPAGLLPGSVGSSSPLVVVAGGLPVNVLPALGGLVGTLSVLSHLAADAATPAGVPLLWPLSDRRVSLGLVRADDPLANFCLLAAGILSTLAWAWPLTRGVG